MTVKAHAKINWTLEVLGLRPDGYRNLRSIVIPVDLHDIITIEEAPAISCVTIGLDVPQEKNLAYRAAAALKELSGRQRGCSISIEKHIPSGAGLGGGSSDAAAVLNALNEMWELNLPCEKLCEVASGIGSDIPALVLGGPVLMEGRGEKVRRIDNVILRELAVGPLPSPESIEVYCPEIFSSTPDVYREFKDADRGKGPNDLQPAALRLYPGIEDALSHLQEKGLKRVTMSGSGSAVYGVVV